MINRLKDNISLTLVEALVAMLILSGSTAGVLGSFSYAFKFIQRAGAKIEAMNYCRKAQEALRAVWLLKGEDPAEERLDNCGWTDIKATPNPNMGYLVSNYSGIVRYMIADGLGNGLPSGAKRISVKAEWD